MVRCTRTLADRKFLIGGSGRLISCGSRFSHITLVSHITLGRMVEPQDDLAVEAGGVGLYEIEPREWRLSWSARTPALLGLPPDTPADLNRALCVVHPDDREGVRQAVIAAMDPAGPGEYLVECRVVLPDGAVRWIESRGRVTFEETGGLRMATLLRGALIDVTHRKHAEDVLREMDRRKDEFIAMIAHELRTPLAPLDTALQLLKAGERTGELPDRLLATMERQIKQLARVSEDLLDLSRAARGIFELRRSNFSIDAIVAQAVETAMPYISAGRHALDVSTGDGVVVHADAARLIQVLANLLVNAARYTPPMGRIWLTARREGDEAVIRVGDTGRGIPPELLLHIFNLFAQVDRPPAERQAGLGIGLTLARRIVEMHGGRIEARSAGVDKGSEFIIHLPLASSGLASHA
jgi:signal transduction histidine kinase